MSLAIGANGREKSTEIKTTEYLFILYDFKSKSRNCLIFNPKFYTIKSYKLKARCGRKLKLIKVMINIKPFIKNNN